MQYFKKLTVVFIISPILIFSGEGLAQNGQNTLNNLSPLSGKWSGNAFGGAVEEQWSSISGNAMMGMFRLVIGEKPAVYEFLLIEQTDAGIRLRFKHIKPGWMPEEDLPLEFILTNVADNQFVFESVWKQNPKKIIYKLLPDDELIVTVENEKNGQTDSFEIKMKKENQLTNSREIK